VRFEPKTIGVEGIVHKYITLTLIWSTQFKWQTDPYIWIASGQAYP